MNKYVLIPHDQYLRFKSFVVENKDKTENVIENPDERKENSIKKDKTDEKESESIEKLDEAIHFNKSLYPEASQEVTYPIPPPGLPAEANYRKNATYFPKIRKNGRRNQEGGGSNEWIKKWNKKF